MEEDDDLPPFDPSESFDLFCRRLHALPSNVRCLLSAVLVHGPTTPVLRRRVPQLPQAWAVKLADLYALDDDESDDRRIIMSLLASGPSGSSWAARTSSSNVGELMKT